MIRGLWWIKRDIRLADNEALHVAVTECDEVLPVYVLEADIWACPDASALHLNAVRSALAELRRNLQQRGADLLVLRGQLPQAFGELRRSFAFDAVYAEEETGTEGTYARDRRVRAWAADAGVKLREFPHAGVIRRLEHRARRSTIWNSRMAQMPYPVPARIPLGSAALSFARDTPLPAFAECGFHPPEGRGIQAVSESAAARTLTSFLTHRVEGYNRGISSPREARSTGSRLSVHLAWGTLSLRTAYQASRDARESGQFKRQRASFEKRLHWHDHFAQRLEDEPAMEFHPLNAAFEALPSTADTDMLQAWIHGRTGQPLVDASIRCLTQTGFLNFRMRAMIVSCACHLMGIPWQEIRYPMARIMADYVPGIHLSQLQMQAGVVGINTIRIYSPAKQITDNDPSCAFIKKWVPELAEFSASRILAHAEHGTDEPLGSYPAALVTYRTHAQAARSRLWSLKQSPEGRREAQRVFELHGSRRRHGR